MKLAAFLVLLFIMPAYAEEDNSLSGQLDTMAQCQAVELSLMQQSNQLAASIAALSPALPPQIKLLRDSYVAIAKDEQAKLQEMAKLTKEAIVPQFPGDSGGQHFMAALSQAVQAVQTALGATDYDGQVKVQSKLLEASHACETFVAHLNKASSF